MKCRKTAIDLLEGSQEGHGHRCQCPRPATFHWKVNRLPATYPCGLDVDLGKLQVSGWKLKKKGRGWGREGDSSAKPYYISHCTPTAQAFKEKESLQTGHAPRVFCQPLASAHTTYLGSNLHPYQDL